MSHRFAQAIIVGASSGIGRELARQLVRSGTRVALVARRAAELEALAAELGEKATPYALDTTCYEQVPARFQEICKDLGGLDLIVYAAGVMPRIGPDEYAFSKDQNIVAVNLLGAIAWINEAAQRFAATRSGTIVGIGSVAGDRGRSGNPVYCTSKAALDTYLEAIRNRVGSLGVHVVTVKPGPVRTPMTEGLDKLPGIIDVDVAARQILAAAAAGKRIAYVPGKWRLIMGVIRSIPSPLFQKLKI